MGPSPRPVASGPPLAQASAIASVGSKKPPRPSDPPSDDDVMQAFGPATRRWFASAFAQPTPVQRAGWKAIAAGENALLLAPTGSGKTLAAFLWCLDRLGREQ